MDVKKNVGVCLLQNKCHICFYLVIRFFLQNDFYAAPLKVIFVRVMTQLEAVDDIYKKTVAKIGKVCRRVKQKCALLETDAT